MFWQGEGILSKFDCFKAIGEGDKSELVIFSLFRRNWKCKREGRTTLSDALTTMSTLKFMLELN